MGAIRARPDRNRLGPRGEQAAERFRRIRRWNPTREFAPFRWKDVLHTMHQKLFERGQVWPIVHLGPMEQMARLRPFDARMNLRGAHYQLASQLRVRGAYFPNRNELERDVNVLGLQHHKTILHSRFTNSE